MTGHEGHKKAADDASVEADITDDDIVESLDPKTGEDAGVAGDEPLDLADEADVELVGDEVAADEDTPTRDLRGARPGLEPDRGAPDPLEQEPASTHLDSLDEPNPEAEVVRDATTGQHAFLEGGQSAEPGGVQDLSEASDPVGLEVGDEETTGEFDHPVIHEDPTGPNQPRLEAPLAELEAEPGSKAGWEEDDTSRGRDAPPRDPGASPDDEPGSSADPAPELADLETTPAPESQSPVRTRSRRRRPAATAVNEEAAAAPATQSGAGERDFLSPPKPLEQAGAAPRHRAASGRSWSEAEPAPQVSLQSDEPLSPEQEAAPGDSTRVEPFGQGAVVASEKTLIFGQEAVAAEPELPFLVIVKGDEEGREVELTQEQYTLGRGPENDLVFPDIACSRRHAQVIRDGDEWFVEDLGSGNGTLLNGQKVNRTRLQNGDEIEVGNTILEFHDPASAGEGGREDAADEDDDLSEPEPTAGGRTTILTGGILPDGGTSPGFVARLLADPKRKKLVVIGGGALGGLILLMLLIRLVAPSPPAGPTPEELERQARMEARREFDKYMDAAKEAVKEKRWREAAEAVQAAAEIDPSSQMVASYKTTIQVEQSAAAAMSRVRGMMENKEWDQAVAALQAIPQESELKEQVASLKKEIDARQLETLLAQGNQMVADKQYNQAVIKFDEVLRRAPGHEEAMVAKRNAEELLEKERKKVAVRPASGKRKRRVATPPPASGLSGQALALYKNGEIDRALDKAESGGATGDELARLRKFKAAYEKAMGQGSSVGQPGKAVDALLAVLKIDKQIAGGAGVYHSQLTQKLAKAYFIKGVDALQSRRLPEAYQSFRSAQKYDPSLPKVQERLGELAKEAKKHYEEAYVIKATNQDLAISKLKIATQIVPPDDIYYNKAKKLLGTLTGEGSSGDGDGDGF